MTADSDAEIQSFIDDILEVLSESSQKKVNREELENEFRKFLEYGVPLDHAKQTLLKKYADTDKPSVSSERMLLVDVQPNVMNVTLLCRVLNINQREVMARGEKRKIFYGILGDESGTVSFTAWKDFHLEKGSVVEIQNAYTKEWQGATQVNFGDRTVVNKTDEQKLPEQSIEPREYKIRELRAGLRSVEVVGRIVDINARDVEVSNVKKRVFSGTIGDETGKAQFTSWHDFHLKSGDVIKVSGAYVKTWKGVPQLTFDEKASVETLDADTISKKAITTQPFLLHELVEKRGALDVEVKGTVIEIREGSGIIYRCPECRRMLQDSTCSVHGDVKGVIDLRVKIVLDDGTGSVQSSLGREATEHLLGKTLDDWKKMYDQPDGEMLVMQELTALLFGYQLNLQGNALGDQYGTNVIVKKVEFVKRDMVKESEQVLRDLEELL